MYMGIGIELKEIHRGIIYNVAPIFREYIDNNSAKRAATNNPFLKDYYKLKKMFSMERQFSLQIK